MYGGYNKSTENCKSSSKDEEKEPAVDPKHLTRIFELPAQGCVPHILLQVLGT